MQRSLWALVQRVQKGILSLKNAGNLVKSNQVAPDAGQIEAPDETAVYFAQYAVHW